MSQPFLSLQVATAQRTFAGGPGVSKMSEYGCGVNSFLPFRDHSELKLNSILLPFIPENSSLKPLLGGLFAQIHTDFR